MENQNLIVSKTQNKCITENSFVADINSLKLPLFIYGNYKPELDANGIVKPIEERRYKWLDSKNQTRELYMYCKGKLPRQFENDAWHGLLGLFVKKNSPFPYNYELNRYEINVNRLDFSWYELCIFMNIPSTGYYIEKLKDSIRILKQTQYFSYEDGALYDKKNNKYLQSGESGMSLIQSYKFKTVKKEALNDEYSTDINSNIVIFSDLIINNLRYEYMKYLDAEMFFTLLPSGIERGIYTYLEANRYESGNKSRKYIKRSYDTLKMGIPVDFNYPSELKRKMKKPLTHLKEIGYISDWCFGDELKLNNIKESCVYFCFGITIDELKNILQRKVLKQEEFVFTDDNNDSTDENNVSKAEYLKLPEKSLIEELVDRKVDRDLASKSVKKKDKWLIIKYILWVDKQVLINKEIKDTGALLSFALRRDEDLKLGAEYSDINKFIEIEKLNSEKDNDTKLKDIRNLYDEYLETNVSNFKATAEYGVIKDLIIDSQNSRIDDLIRISTGDNVIKYKEFKEKQENSNYFKELLTKEVKMMKNLMSLEEFTSKYLKN